MQGILILSSLSGQSSHVICEYVHFGKALRKSISEKQCMGFGTDNAKCITGDAYQPQLA